MDLLCHISVTLSFIHCICVHNQFFRGMRWLRCLVIYVTSPFWSGFLVFHCSEGVWWSVSRDASVFPFCYGTGWSQRGCSEHNVLQRRWLRVNNWNCFLKLMITYSFAWWRSLFLNKWTVTVGVRKFLFWWCSFTVVCWNDGVPAKRQQAACSLVASAHLNVV